MKMNDFEIEAMLSIRFYQRFFIFVISPDYDTVIEKSFFVLMLDSEGYFLTVDVVGRSYLHRIVYDMSCNDSVNTWHMMRNYISLSPRCMPSNIHTRTKTYRNQDTSNRRSTTNSRQTCQTLKFIKKRR